MYYSKYVEADTHLIKVNTLTAKLADKSQNNLVVIDASIPMPGEKRDCLAEFKEKHIPGARFFDLRECLETNTDNAYMLPSREKFAAYAGSLGILSSSEVVVYDANMKKGMFSAPRAWYMFRVFGHQMVYVLDGGLKKWLADGLAVESGDHEVPKTVEYVGASYKSELVKSLDDVKDNITEKKFQLIDARSPGRFNGTAPEPRPDIKPGHIPDSKNMFWTQFIDDGVYKSPEQLAEIYKTAGVDPKSAHVATCGTGVTASFIALTSYILGNYNVPIYDGAWFDWYLHAPDDLKVDIPKE